MYCMNCGTALPDDALFCSHCGTAQQPMTKTALPAKPELPPTEISDAPRGTFTVSFDDPGDENILIQRVNSWLADNPTLGNISCQFSTGSRLGLLTNHTVLSNVTLQYSELGGRNQYVYRLEHLVWFGLYAKGTGAVLAEWKREHPNAIVLKASGSTNSRGTGSSLLFGGIGASNETAVYVFYKQRRVMQQAI